ncbi:rhodanese-like domain-containing protein [Gordonia sp. ABSL11-1]|uniref:sulfurtransferase n=1 Tax=Gordonia sp. ABSL11-1 TaxID=3053924 RepID=UPI0025732148|nr:rhodanese-like domain-containing protein [Gordonia sp. ABSL11-1]MDL9947934.1 rhodanese-like domain-containing protein [Gordonia sp. ABSL11-1]
MTGTRADHLSSAATLRRSGHPAPVVLDVRVDAGGRADRDAYRRGHLPGAHFVDIDADLAGTVTARSGARPLPDPDRLAASARRWGITPTSPVVVYDDSRSTAAARAWWVLRWAGIADVRVLDGGLRAWTGAGGALETGDRPEDRENIEIAPVEIRPGALPVVGTDDVARLARDGLLLDARPVDDYLGRNGASGHIPGAVSASVFDDLDDEGRVLDDAALRSRYRALGALDAGIATASYCGSGVAAALQVLVLATVGVESAFYPGSLSQWVSDPARIVIRETLSTVEPGPVISA